MGMNSNETTMVRVSKNGIRFNEVVIAAPELLGEKLIDLRKRYPEHTFRFGALQRNRPYPVKRPDLMKKWWLGTEMQCRATCPDGERCELKARIAGRCLIHWRKLGRPTVYIGATDFRDISRKIGEVRR